MPSGAQQTGGEGVKDDHETPGSLIDAYGQLVESPASGPLNNR